ncbi:MAG: GFA family protein [Deltaproteobacteria bacterium]
MGTKTAACACGQLTVTVEGEPVRLSMCHCFECQRRTGSVFGVQARYPVERVKASGEASVYERPGDTGNVIRFSFCPTCATTLHWTIDAQPELVAVAVGAFADPSFGAPTVSVYEDRRHGWVDLSAMAIEHLD